MTLSAATTDVVDAASSPLSKAADIRNVRNGRFDILPSTLLQY